MSTNQTESVHSVTVKMGKSLRMLAKHFRQNPENGLGQKSEFILSAIPKFQEEVMPILIFSELQKIRFIANRRFDGVKGGKFIKIR